MSEQKKKRILVIAGHTASGKSGVAMRLARELGGEIVCCDSMQIYKRMDIGTAKPTAADMAEVPHHAVDFAEPSEPFSCADYVSLASEAIDLISERGKLPIVCGGTGLYLDCLLYRRPFDESGGKSEIRERLMAEAELYGAHQMHQRLQEIDPESALAIHENNVRRVVRALEIFETTGVRKSELDKRVTPSEYDFLALELRVTDMRYRYSRIERRVDEMLLCGLLSETEALLSEGVFDSNTTAAQAIGYKEMIPAVRGEMSISGARERLIIATRQYAKRQVTWFSSKSYISTLEIEQGRDAADDVLSRALEFLGQ